MIEFTEREKREDNDDLGNLQRIEMCRGEVEEDDVMRQIDRCRNCLFCCCFVNNLHHLGADIVGFFTFEQQPLKTSEFT